MNEAPRLTLGLARPRNRRRAARDGRGERVLNNEVPHGPQMPRHRQGCPGRPQCEPLQRQDERRFLPNLQTISVLSDVLGPVRMRLSAAAIRTIEYKGGIDAFLKGTPDGKLSPEIRRLKKRITTAAARRAG